MKKLLSFDLSSISNDKLHEYASSGYKKIEGWGIDEQLIEIFLYLDNYQKKKKIQGNLVEIGVHHGRSLILLAMIAQVDEKTIAIDIFDNQSRNIDNSGSGSRSIFEGNLKSHHIFDNVHILEDDSMFIKLVEHPVLNSPSRLIHIDGGHYVDAVCNDLALSQSIVCPGGIVIVDDYLHSGFPGVNEGCHKYLSSRVPRKLIPFAVGKNKLFLTTHSHHSIIVADLLENCNDGAKKVTIHGFDAICLDPH